MKKLILFVFASFFILSYWITNSYNQELVVFDDNKSIRELKENLTTLDDNSKKLDNQFDELNADYRLKAFLRQDLSKTDIGKLKEIIANYNKSKNIIELKQYNDAKHMNPVIEEKKLLLIEKKKLYSALIKYIDTRFKKQYLEYIRHDAMIFDKQYNITTDIIRKKEILHTKVETIEIKIKKHKKNLNDNLKKVIESKINQKIANLKVNEKFKLLNIETKVKVLDKTITKLNIKLQNYKRSIWSFDDSVNFDNSYQDTKVQTYDIAIRMLKRFKYELANEK